MNEAYPTEKRTRDRWITSHRNADSLASRTSLDPERAYAQWVDDERSDTGRNVQVATIFLTNRECPWRCLMCDLWKNTLAESVPVGAIPIQIAHALAQLPPASQVKLYNSGSFFDRRAIPVTDIPAIAAQLSPFERVIVESHPSLVGSSCLRFRELLAEQGVADLEVAMGLETADPEVLGKLNKRMTLKMFADAAGFLRRNGISLRVFILVQPPFMEPRLALAWAKRSIDLAFDCGAGVAVLIPTRAGNGALEALASQGHFAPPRLSLLESAADYGVSLDRGRVFVDLWDLDRFSECEHCFAARAYRLEELNREQKVAARISCNHCGDGT